jgi:molybdate transport system substrate-binding protein
VRRGFAALAFALAVAACTGDAAGPAGSHPVARTPDPAAIDLDILAAASLKGALERVEATYEGGAGVQLTISTESSAALEAKIEQGAPADLFLSADTTNPQKLVDRGFADGAAVTFAGNRLTVIVPEDNPAGIRSPADLAKPGVKVIAAGDEVPITKYARQLVHGLALQPGYPADFEAAYAMNVVSREDNVASVVAKIALGEGDAAICYRTDAMASAAVEAIDVAVAANPPVRYAGIVVKASAHPDAARAFLDWLLGPDGQGVLAGFGFLPPAP